MFEFFSCFIISFIFIDTEDAESPQTVTDEFLNHFITLSTIMEPPIPLTQDEKGAMLLEMIPKWKTFSDDSISHTENKIEVIDEKQDDTSLEEKEKSEKYKEPLKDTDATTNNNSPTEAVKKEIPVAIEKLENGLVIPPLNCIFFFIVADSSFFQFDFFFDLFSKSYSRS